MNPEKTPYTAAPKTVDLEVVIDNHEHNEKPAPKGTIIPNVDEASARHFIKIGAVKEAKKN